MTHTLLIEQAYWQLLTERVHEGPQPRQFCGGTGDLTLRLPQGTGTDGLCEPDYYTGQVISPGLGPCKSPHASTDGFNQGLRLKMMLGVDDLHQTVDAKERAHRIPCFSHPI